MNKDLILHKINKYKLKLQIGTGDSYVYQQKLNKYKAMIGGTKYTYNKLKSSDSVSKLAFSTELQTKLTDIYSYLYIIIRGINTEHPKLYTYNTDETPNESEEKKDDVLMKITKKEDSKYSLYIYSNDKDIQPINQVELDEIVKEVMATIKNIQRENNKKLEVRVHEPLNFND